MQEQDQLKNWLKDNLEEELRAVHFSTEARAKVKKTVITGKGIKSINEVNAIDGRVKPNAAEIVGLSDRDISWWEHRIALPRGIFAACVIILLLITGVYTTTFFYVAPQEIAQFQADRPQVIVPSDNTPFGALQMAVLHMPDNGGNQK
ncbi:hypothetical protein LPY66_16130 [Dehalobacter sp. DCM]|uniref:hypothetical protein n=1 Tax=Dehalobacter sp. DCM TaxID=2907827 RepID=UPI003081CC5D|nr:hypothetical protein LPY66_16130 [Dehalobacter sp. DCM]